MQILKIKDIFINSMNKLCKQCKIDKFESDFRHQIRGDKVYISRTCKKCDAKNGKSRHLKFRQLNRDKLREYNKRYYLNNKNEIKERQKDKKRIWDRKYYLKNKKVIQKKRQLKNSEKYKKDINFRIRKTVSKAISRHLKLNGSSKNKKSCLNFLQYSINDLRVHLELLFEPWMNWNNYGMYDSKTWKDDDISTWTWQIDHIIPHSDFVYASMEDENFKKCWSLANLRPLSSKINNLDGVNRVRHRSLKWFP